jgi:hypothetical protein
MSWASATAERNEEGSAMSSDREADLAASSRYHQALERWANEGGNVDHANHQERDDRRRDIPPLADAELIQLRIRVIALENLIVALLTEASARQLDIARDMASYIAPRPGFTPHKLTMQAKTHMVGLIERAAHFGPENSD